jgi:hypothetical protein
MPRSKRSELITLRVDLVKELKEKWIEERKKSPFVNEHFGGFVNDLLHDILEKDEFLKHYAPFLSEDGCSRDTIYIKDFKENKTAEVHFHDNRLYCSLCESFSCFHIQFVMAIPRVAKLNPLHKPIMDNDDVERDGQKAKKMIRKKRSA